MSGQFGFIDIILLAMFAGFIILRLRNILGRKTGYQGKPTNRYFPKGMEVLKDIEIFQKVADEKKIPLEIAPKLIEIFKDGISTYGHGAFSPSIIRRLEDKTGLQILCDGFPENIEDDDDEVTGYEV